MTRYEQIQKMSLDELAEYLCDQTETCKECLGFSKCSWNIKEHGSGLKRWLEEKVDEND